MNLFESSLQSLMTKENSIYIEAVTKIFNVLFEAKMKDAAKFTAVTPAGEELATRNAYSEPIPTTVKQTVDSFEKDALGTFARFIFALYDSAKTARFADVIAASIPEDQFNVLETQFNNCVLNGSLEWSKVVNAVGTLCRLYPKNKDILRANIQKNKRLDSNKILRAFDKYTNALTSFIQILPPAITAATKAGNKDVIDITTKPKVTVPKPKKDKIINVTDKYINAIETGKLDDTPDSKATSTGSAGASGSASGSAKAPKKPEPPTKDTPAEEDPYRYIMGTVNPELVGNEITIACSPEQANSMMSDVQEGIQALYTARPHFIKNGDIKVNTTDGAISITYPAPDNVTNQQIITVHNVALYCLMMDLTKKYALSKATIGLSPDVAKSVEADSNGTKSALQKLISKDENAQGSKKYLDTNAFAQQLATDGNDHQYDADIVRAMSSLVDTWSVQDPVGFKNAYDPHSNLDAANQQIIDHARVFLSTDGSDFLTKVDEQQTTSPVLDRLNNIQDLAYKLRDCIIEEKNTSKTDTPYNVDAARVVDICKQAVINKANNTYSFDTGHTVDPYATDDESGSLDDMLTSFDTSFNELSDLPQFAD